MQTFSDRIQIFSIEIDLRWNHSIWKEIESNHILCHGENVPSMCLSAIRRLHHFLLFNNRFGSSGISITISSEVRTKTHNKKRDLIRNFCDSDRFPVDWKNPLGYLIVIIYEYVVVSYICLIGASIIALGIGSFLQMIAASKCIKGSLFAIGQCRNSKTNQHILDKLIVFIQFDARVKELSLEWECDAFFSLSLSLNGFTFILDRSTISSTYFNHFSPYCSFGA